MTALGSISPVIRDLDAVEAKKAPIWQEQGEIEADENGTIALSYESTKLHKPSVEPIEIIVAMDGKYAAASIIIVVAAIGPLIAIVNRLKL